MRRVVRITMFFILYGVLASSGVAKDSGDSKNLLLSVGDIAMGQIADGEGWSTTLTFVNLQLFSRTFDVIFTGDDGNPLVLNFKNIGATSTLSFSIPSGGTQQVETTGASFPVVQGWAAIIAIDGDSTPIGGMAILRSSRPGLPDFESVVPFSNVLDIFQVLSFDHRNGLLTGVALANPSFTSPMTISINFFDINGVFISSGSITLQGGQHTAFLLDARFPELADRAGIAEFTGIDAAQTVGPVILGLRFNPSGPFTTLFPMTLP